MAEAAIELREILDAAERAAAAEDFVSAEQHLRQAAILQEQQLGEGHPDLANTLNNLGIVSEYVGKPAEAEASYRRAYRIASAALPADHPLVQTSGKNLKDFCEAIGKPPDLPERVPPELETFAPEPQFVEPRPALAAVPPVVKTPPAPPSPPPVAIPDLPLRAPEERAPSAPARAETAAIRISSPVSPPSNRPTTAIAVVALVVLAVAAWWFGLREPSGTTTPVAPVVDTAPAREEPPIASVPEQTAPREEPPPSVAPEPPAAQAPAETPPIAEAPATPAPTEAAVKNAGDAAVSVVDAKVCRPLSTSNWTCTPAANPSSPGAFFFYTRVRSARDTTVQHRWLSDGRLLRSVNLRIRANPGAGYRTYSRNTVSAERRGDWTVELRDADGALLQEERFTVK